VSEYTREIIRVNKNECNEDARILGSYAIRKYIFYIDGS